MQGLTAAQAAERRKQYGANALAQVKAPGPVRIFLGQFKDAMVLILIAATGISAWLGEVTDAVTILAIVILNAVLGFVQEYRTEKTLETLRSMTAPTAKVYRGGILRIIGIIPAIVAVILFVLTEDIRLPMWWWDRWTIWMIIILLIEIIIAFFARRRVKENDEEDQEGQEGEAS